MNFKNIISTVKKSWNWIWNSDSILSWFVALALIFVFIKFIFFPTLSLIMGTSLPLAGVESSSMDHSTTKQCLDEDYKGRCIAQSDDYEICGNKYNDKKSFNFDKYWEICGHWYEEKSITKQAFSKFLMKNGFKKGDIIIVWGRFNPKIGDIIIFKPNKESLSQTPIIHRIVSIENGIIQTKGDHNERQLTLPNRKNTDETHIEQKQLVGKAIFKIPYLGYVKIWAVEIFKIFL